MFNHILVAIDGSDLGQKAAEMAAELAQKLDSSLTVLHVVPSMLPSTFVDGMAALSMIDYDAYRAQALQEGEALLRNTVRQLAYPKTSSLLQEAEQGEPVEKVVLNQANNVHAQLIVLGTHGRGGITRLILGSVAEGVLRHSPVPVLLIKETD